MTKNNVINFNKKRNEIQDIISQIKNEQVNEATKIIYSITEEMIPLLNIIGAKGLSVDDQGKVKFNYKGEK